MDQFDVAIIGAGVCGANIARRLSQYELDVALLEKEVDVSLGTSKANSGIVHGGFHDNISTLKARLELRGALMFDRLHEELDFPFERCGILVAALHEDEMRAIEQLIFRAWRKRHRYRECRASACSSSSPSSTPMSWVVCMRRRAASSNPTALYSRLWSCAEKRRAG